ncbi:MULTISPECIES: hypothetical protein [Frankia]|uniref:Uncharacterized protein n=1 Tax=Frankia alni (strain DSM 45986 / CECT 9034 / ACN14a) TaxID=326424 RepID=Q0RGF6_FRAAA|nr:MULTISPECIES: hypothetical protein [Frankia]CAJ63431.1 hypothetical protein; putative signal peptide [Frankia alni ACN14a]
MNGPVTPIVAGTNIVSVAIPAGKVPVGGAEITAGNDSALINSFGPDGAGNWSDRILASSGGGTAQAIVFVIDA